jgi:hypothetical protein
MVYLQQHKTWHLMIFDNMNPMKEAKHMLGMLFNEKECKELDYVLRKELDEMLLDLSDQRLDQNIRHAIANRYKTIFRMYARFAPQKELSKYAWGGRSSQFKH